jgi:cell wall-associated NlpC family hydrolase
MILTLISRPAARTLAATVLVWLLHVGVATPALALQSVPEVPQPERRSGPADKPAAGGEFWKAKARELRAERRAQRRAERRAAVAERRAARAERRAAAADERRTARLVKRAERAAEPGAEDPDAGQGAAGDDPAQPGEDPADAPAETPAETPADPVEVPADPAEEPAAPARPTDGTSEPAEKPRAEPPAAAPAARKPARSQAPAPVAEPAPAPVDVEPAPGEPAPFFPLPVRPVPYTGAPGTVRTILTAAQRQIGWPYVWGGESRAEGGFDCSGLIDHAYWSAGIELPGRPTAAVLWQMSQPIGKEQLRPGDLVFVGAPSGAPHHVAMYVGDGMVVVARYTGTLITLQPLDAVAWDGFGRLLSGGDVAPAAAQTVNRPADDAPERPDDRNPTPADPTPTRPDAIAWLDRISRICPMPDPEADHDGESDAPATLAELVDPDGDGLPGGVA